MINIPTTISTYNAEQTEKFGAELANTLISDTNLPRFIALYGDLGVGKTAFVRGFTSVIAPDKRVKSPTFALVHEYTAGGVSVFHFDMYRITDEDDLYSIGFYDYRNRNGIILIEWSENIPYALPERYFEIRIEKDSDADPDSRFVEATLVDASN